MSDYTPITNFRRKDTLPTGTPDKLITGAELQDEFDAIETAVATKIDAADLPGTPVTTDVAVAFTAGFGTAAVAVAAVLTAVIDALLSNVFVITYTGAAVTINAPTNPILGQKIYFKLVNGVGASTFTWNSVYVFRAAESKQPTQTLAAIDLVQAIYDGTNWLTTYLGKNFG